MRRLICLFLLMCLPLQMSWAVVAVHCQHETGPKAPRHFGHHAHVHVDPSDGARPAGQPHPGGVDKKAVADSDCAICHLSLAAPVSEVLRFEAEPGQAWHSLPVPSWRSPIAARLERPDIRLAA